MRVALLPLSLTLSLSLPLFACSGANGRGDRALGVVGIDDGFAVTIASQTDTEETMIVQENNSSGALVWGRLLNTAARNTLPRVQMKRLTNGRTVLATESGAQLAFVESKGSGAQIIDVFASAKSRVRDGADWIIAGVDAMGRLHRYRLRDEGTTGEDLIATPPAGATIGDVRAVADGGLVAVVNGSVQRYDNTGAATWSWAAPSGAALGQFLQSPDASVRVVVQGATTSTLVTLDATGAVAAQHELAVRLPETITPLDDGSITYATPTGAARIDANATVRWQNTTNYGERLAIFANDTKTWIAVTFVVGTHDEVTVNVLDNGTGGVLQQVNTTASKWGSDK